MNRRTVIAAVIAAVAALVLVIILDREVTSPERETVTVTKVPIPGPTPDVVVDADQQQESSARPAGPAEHQDAKDETPPGVTPADVEGIVESRPAGIGKPQPLGGAQLLSCTTHLVQNFSDRQAGAKVSMPVIHYTVSKPGTLDSIRNLFNTPSFAASSHDLLEPSGRCVHIVDYSKKAWTEGAFNSVADSIEIVCCLSDPPRSWWVAQPIISKSLLASWIVDRLRARGLPARLVNPDGCTPQAGYTDHLRLECGNTHTDVGAHFPWDVVGNQVRTLMNGTRVVVWRAVSKAGKVLHTERAKAVDGTSGYRRLVEWMRGPGAATVRAAEKASGSVLVRKVAIVR